MPLTPGIELAPGSSGSLSLFRQAAPAVRKNFLQTLLKSNFLQNISSIVEAKRLGKPDENSVRFHIAQGGCGYEDLRFFAPVPLYGRL
jgi:hypothetical protein